MVQFSPDPAAAGLFWLDGLSGIPSGFAVGYVPLPGTVAPTGTLTLADSWRVTPGVYLFLTATPGDKAAFLVQLAEVLANPAYTDTRFLWLAGSPDRTAEHWTPAVLQLSQNAGGAGRLDHPSLLAFAGYRLGLPAATAIDLDDGADGFVLTPGQNPAAAIYLGYGGLRRTATGPAALPFAGARVGTVGVSLALATADFAALDVGLRYFIPQPPAPNARIHGVTSLGYPVFDPAPAALTFTASFDPLYPLECSRTMLTFPACAPLAAYFRTGTGRVVTLTPQPAATLPAGLGFARRPHVADAAAATDYYLAPLGDFTLGIQNAPIGATAVPRLLCGWSGVEYLHLDNLAGGLTLRFVPGQPAYARAIGAAAAEAGPAFTTLGTTSWLMLRAAVSYFAQPESAPLFQPGATDDGWLDYFESVAGTLPADPVADAGFPMVPYAGIAAKSLAPFRDLERRAIAPARREALRVLAPPRFAQINDDTAGYATTPQGLLLAVAGTAWQRLFLASPGRDPGEPIPSLENRCLNLSAVTGRLRAALQSPQLFLVIANPDALASGATLEYRLTEAALADLATMLPDGAAPLLASLRASTMFDAVYFGEATFLAALVAVIGQAATDLYREAWLACGAYFEVTIEGWRFRLSPKLWWYGLPLEQRGKAGTVMILKFTGATLKALAADTAAWTWPEAAAPDGRDPGVVRDRLVKLIADAEAAPAGNEGTAAPLADFVRIANDPGWNGVLFLDVDVPLDTLPDELAGIASGIDAAKFRAHHLGISASPVDRSGGTLWLARSALFGLIDYDDPTDLDFREQDYAFKVLNLRVLFRSSAVAGFSSRIELMINRLFGEPASLIDSTHLNNLILDGVYQKEAPHPGDPAAAATARYSFGFSGSNRFRLDSAVLESIEMTRARFVTRALDADGARRSRFLLDGRIRFRVIGGLDLFSFGPEFGVNGPVDPDGFLLFSGMSIDMTVRGAVQSFAFTTGDLALDVAASVARGNSFYNHFPVDLTGIVRGTEPLRSAGYQPVRLPVGSVALGAEWNALAMRLDLGTLGALAGNAAFVVTILCAWSPGTLDRPPALQVGLRLPGAQAADALLPVQGVLKLGFRNIELDAAVTDAGASYVLRLRQFAIQVLGASFPKGSADVAIFGNPAAGGSGGRGALAWYAAYREKGKAKSA
jgi:hypothetical protein